MTYNLKGRIALVTGAARGVGRADAIKLAASGAQVILTDLDVRGGEGVAKEIGDNAVFIEQDVSDERAWQQVVEFADQHFGRLDVLVNNAAILKLGNVLEESLLGWQRVFKINTDSVFLGIHYCLPLLERSGGASIINMGSSSALMGMPNFAAYSASKAAVRGITQSVAVFCKQRGKGVRCNALYPDSIMTPMTAELQANAGDRKLADSDKAGLYVCTADDVANSVLFLASDESRHINGACITLDGGASITPPYL